MTKLEKTLLINITKESQWDCCNLDFTKSWDEQELEADYFEDFCDAKDYAKRFNMNVRTVRGVLGSLRKKGFIDICDGSDFDMSGTVLLIGEHEFNRILEDLKSE